MDEVAIYWFSLDATPEQLAAWRGWLSPQEQARADRYLRPEHGSRYIAAHAHLRWLLGRELHRAPEAVRFVRGEHGKPALEDGPEHFKVHFNLSHSGALGLVGLSRSGALGVDIEGESARDFAGLARRFFAPQEQAWLLEQPPAQQAHAFARLWTCKEAWMKADGRGLAVLRQPLATLQGTARLHAGGRAWWVRELETETCYAAAVVREQEPEAVSARKLTLPLR